jgi:hypothetical protein
VTGVTPLELSALYPRLYHMAEPNTWEKIKKAGLLCTSVILDECLITGDARKALELTKREHREPVQHPTLGELFLRDQKPLYVGKLAKSLTDCTVEQWFRMLNGRVFFWPTWERLERLMRAREYAGRRHLVLTVDTLALTTDYENKITLAPMNTGNTMPIAHPRGLATFSRMKDYPFQERLKRGPYYTIVEVAVEGGVRDLFKYVIRAEHATYRQNGIKSLELLFERQP